ncbi:unnamed protein product (macronuclear) [Paramecium tetraurelia]|uniref:Uncharacterized protein n=1 Tax=Paramecium tetraurelia TaxID=5888 RepID=A0BUD6_PARTE|nr:uncharacterized protein GSPATT00032385001 [Paramecium tetraurelia]CAK62153.1 unnamed protein product [Paramecium tetraurelia]|eukprot:XP_001429551.1 hypothetical protein (macronuclear) [Paramecium tetraurelia strain d4-2]
MQYGKRENELRKPKIELLFPEELDKQILPNESVESLDSFLPQYHSSNQQQFESEHRIVLYLRQLGIEFKTDPRNKEQEYYEKSKKKGIIFQASISESPQLGPQKNNQIFQLKQMNIGEFTPWLNPLLARKKQSLET